MFMSGPLLNHSSFHLSNPSFLLADMSGQLSDTLPLCQHSLWHTSVFTDACTHAGSNSAQLRWTYTEYKTWQAGRLTQWYRLCFARWSYCNWSAFQSLRFSKKNVMKADSICWISLCSRANASLSATQLQTLPSKLHWTLKLFFLYLQHDLK